MKKLLLASAFAATLAFGGYVSPAQAGNGLTDYCQQSAQYSGESVGDCVSEFRSRRPEPVSFCKEVKEEWPYFFSYFFGNLGQCIQWVRYW